MRADSAVVEEWPVWLEVNGEPAVTWMCTPDQLEELAVGWLHGEGYIASLDDLVQLRPCAPDLGFWADVKPERLAQVKGENRKRVLASGCGAVATMLADPEAMSRRAPLRGEPPAPETLRALFKQLFASGARYNETGGIHAAALTDSTTLLSIPKTSAGTTRWTRSSAVRCSRGRRLRVAGCSSRAAFPRSWRSRRRARDSPGWRRPACRPHSRSRSPSAPEWSSSAARSVAHRTCTNARDDAARGGDPPRPAPGRAHDRGRGTFPQPDAAQQFRRPLFTAIRLQDRTGQSGSRRNPRREELSNAHRGRTRLRD